MRLCNRCIASETTLRAPARGPTIGPEQPTATMSIKAAMPASCLVCTAGLLGASTRAQMGMALSRETGKRVFEDTCFVKLLQDAWLQESLKEMDNAQTASFLKALFRSRGRGAGTPFMPMPSVIVLVTDMPTQEIRRALLSKSAQTSDPTSSISSGYIEMLHTAYVSYISSLAADVPIVRVSLADPSMSALRGTNSQMAAEVFTQAVAEGLAKQQEAIATQTESNDDVVSPPASPTSLAAAASVWTRITSPLELGASGPPLDLGSAVHRGLLQL